MPGSLGITLIVFSRKISKLSFTLCLVNNLLPIYYNIAVCDGLVSDAPAVPSLRKCEMSLYALSNEE